MEINTSGEPQKHGFLSNQQDEIIDCFNETNINIEGFMTVGPRTTDVGKIRASFIQLRELRDSVNQKTPQQKMKELSMGMSSDYEIAVEEGATMIRLGSLLFGNRA